MIRFSKLKLLINLEIKKLLKTNRGKFLTSATALFMMSFFIEIYVIIGTLIFYDRFRNLIPISLSLISFITIFIMGAKDFLTNLFSEKEYNILFSLPFYKLEIILSKVFGMYINFLIYSFLFLCFPLIYYTYRESAIYFIFFDILIILVFPIIPASLAFIFSVFKPKSKYVKYSKQLISIITITLIVILYMLMFLFRNLFYENIYIAVNKITYLFKKIIFPINFFNDYVLNKNIFGFLLFIILSLVIAYLVFLVISKNYFKFKNSASRSTFLKKSSIDFSRKSYKRALFLRELKNYFSSTTYISNTIFMPILLIAFTIFRLLMNDSSFVKLSGSENITNMINNNLVFILCSVNAFSQVTYCSISIEGKYNYILRTLPISNRDINLSKIKFGLSIISLPLIFASIGLGYKYNYTILDITLTSICAISYAIFSNLLGLFYDQKTYNFTWSNEMEIIKQRFSVIFLQIAIMIPLLISYAISKNLIINPALVIIIFINLINILIWNKIKNNGCTD